MTFKETTQSMGLFDDDKGWITAMNEVSSCISTREEKPLLSPSTTVSPQTLRISLKDYLMSSVMSFFTKRLRSTVAPEIR